MVLQAFYMKLGLAEDEADIVGYVHRIIQIDGELEAKGYKMRILCLGCGFTLLVKNANHLQKIQDYAREHARSHEGEARDIFGDPMPSNTDDLVHLFHLEGIGSRKWFRLGVMQ